MAYVRWHLQVDERTACVCIIDAGGTIQMANKVGLCGGG
jgi:hypothetical protein